jgi:putative transposase
MASVSNALSSSGTQWLYLRFSSLSYRDVEDLLAERGEEVSYEKIRRWVLKFGVLFARELRKRRPRTSSQWHLNELVVVIGGKRFFLWRAVDSEGGVPEERRFP